MYLEENTSSGSWGGLKTGKHFKTALPHYTNERKYFIEIHINTNIYIYVNNINVLYLMSIMLYQSKNKYESKAYLKRKWF